MNDGDHRVREPSEYIVVGDKSPSRSDSGESDKPSDKGEHNLQLVNTAKPKRKIAA